MTILTELSFSLRVLNCLYYIKAQVRGQNYFTFILRSGLIFVSTKLFAIFSISLASHVSGIKVEHSLQISARVVPSDLSFEITEDD